MKNLFHIALISCVGLFVVHTVFAAECETSCGSVEECTEKIKTCQKIWEDVQKAKAPHESSLKKMEADIAAFQKKIAAISEEVKIKEKEIDKGEGELSTQQELLARRVRQVYIRSFSRNPLYLFLGKSADFVNNMRVVAYQQAVAEEDKRVIVDIVGFITNLEKRKAQLSQEKAGLAQLSASLNVQAEAARKLISEASAYQSTLSSSIGQLSAKQQALLAEKTGTFTTSVGDVPLADDPNSQPNFNPGFSPAFAAFSFGAPHYKGMSQYGAYGRAKAGQNSEEILKAYYGGGIEIKKDYSTSINITVNGYGTVDIETYVKRIYEMPGSWGDSGGMEALKAQAVAARSYGLAYTNNGSKPICATEACQVYKPANKGGKWDEAVNATRGWVLQASGSPFSALYASTSGGHQDSYSSNGYSTPGFWDTTSDWTRWAEGAWEVKGGSPWFYKGWYKTRSGVTCGRSHPWLNEREMSDILNAAIVLSNGGDASGIFPVDNACLSGGSGWSKDRMVEEAGKYGGAVTSISAVKVEHGSNGTSSKVTFQTNRGEVSISGSNFSKSFNLRAPGAIHLKSGLFNIEKK